MSIFLLFTSIFCEDSNPSEEDVKSQVQENGDMKTIARVLAMTRQFNGSLQASANAVDSAQLGISIACSAWAPKVQFKSTYTKADEQVTYESSRISKGYSNAFSLEQPIYYGGTLWNQLAKSKKELLQVKIQDTKTQNDIYASAALAAYEVVFRRELVLLHEEMKDKYEKLYLAAKLKYEVGEHSFPEFKQAELAKVAHDVKLRKFQNELDQAQIKFEGVVGQPVPSDLSLKFSPITLPSKDLEEIIKIALRHNPDLNLKRIAQKLVKIKKDGVFSQFQPQVKLEAQSTFSRAKRQYRGYYRYAKRMFNDLEYINQDHNRGDSISLSVTVPIFSGFSSILGLEQVRVENKKAYSTMVSVRDQVVSAIKKLWTNLSIMEDNIKTLKVKVELTKIVYEGDQEAYRLGEKDLTNVIETMDKYLSAESELYESKNKRITQLYQLLQLLGHMSWVHWNAIQEGA